MKLLIAVVFVFIGLFVALVVSFLAIIHNGEHDGAFPVKSLKEPK